MEFMSISFAYGKHDTQPCNAMFENSSRLDMEFIIATLGPGLSVAGYH